MKKVNYQTTSFNVDQSFIGETLEEKVFRIVNNNEPVDEGAPLIFTDRKDGVLPQYDIRTDRWELAVEATDKLNREALLKRQERANEKSQENLKKQADNNTDTGITGEISGGEPIK